MNRELTAEEVIYNFEVSDVNLENRVDTMPEYEQVYEKIKTALEIDKEGYNIYLIDDFSKDKLDSIVDFVGKALKNDCKLQDICYVVDGDIKYPKALFLEAGMGKKLKDTLQKIQTIYFESTYEFYNSSSNKEKEELVENLQKKRSDLINKLVKISEDEGFTLKPTQSGFTFIPLKSEGDMMSESDYDSLDEYEKEEIISKVSTLKNSAQEVLEELKDIELSEIEKIKLLIDEHYELETEDIKREYTQLFDDNKEALEFLDIVCNNIETEIKKIYSINYDDDEEEIKGIIYKYLVNVLVDNSKRKNPPIIFEEDPSINNLLGSIEYENKNGTYSTDVSLIRAGSFLKAHGGCLILRVSSLINNSSAYYYFKKSLVSGKLDLDYNRGYLELLSLSGLKPEPIKFKEKIILIGDYNTYDLLYRYDEDFKKIFKIRAEYNSVLDIDKNNKQAFLGRIFSLCKNNKLHSLTDDAVKELAKFLSRKAEDRGKLFIDDYELGRILMISNNKVERDNRKFIEGKDVVDAAYEEELIEKQVCDNYKEKKIFIDVKGKLVGQVNALSVIDTGYFSFGKPIRVTCSCYKGDGNILDVQKESNLSGNIHNKAISTLRGYITTLIGGYDKVPVDFHLSFEQLYGKIDGDSASVAEAISMLSALSKVGINQNIAVTGSINQFGKVQPIGGVNEKIEGFFKVCKMLDTVEGKGVLIPESNVGSLILKNEIEEEVKKGNFHIYSMSTIEDAVEVLMGENNLGYKEIMHMIEKEIKKYSSRNENRRHK